MCGSGSCGAASHHAALAVLAAAGGVALADVACQRPHRNAGWQLVPTPCAGLDAALPMVVGRSRAEAGQLVRRLLPAEQQRLRAGLFPVPLPLPACICVCCHPSACGVIRECGLVVPPPWWGGGSTFTIWGGAARRAGDWLVCRTLGFGWAWMQNKSLLVQLYRVLPAQHSDMHP